MISLNNVTVAFGSFTLLDDVSLHISETDKIGLVGKKRRAIVARKRVDDRGRVVGEIQNADVVFERMRAI